MDKRRHTKTNSSLQKRFYAILNAVLKFKESFMHYSLSKTFKNKELEIVFANIRV
ncbi:hypothetical protein [Flavobacterium sp.]|uniref:hypothetical protein n=1 Tax=Flavobacterium sp. TaxID=239 RepID=UPI00286D9D8D|nr:hypothetical protein [Flavobacterium sp.]